MAIQVALSIESRLENLELVQLLLEEALALRNVGEDFCYQVGLAVREAVANAIEHGNEAVADKKVDIELELASTELVIRIRDRGAGFDPGTVADPLAPSNLLNASGRGILFMKEFMDEIDYTVGLDEGTQVTLRKLWPVPSQD